MTLVNYLASLAVALWAFLVFEDEIYLFFKHVFDTSKGPIELLSWRKELVLHAAFYGGFVGAFVNHDDPVISKTIAVVWFLAGLWYSHSLARTIAEREAHEERKDRHMLSEAVRASLTNEDVDRQTKVNEKT